MSSAAATAASSFSGNEAFHHASPVINLIVIISVGFRMSTTCPITISLLEKERTESRRGRIYGGRDWVRLGAVELSLDCLRRYLQGLLVTERTDF